MRFLIPFTLAISLGLAAAAGADDLGKKMTDPVTQKSVTVAKDTPTVIVNGNHLYFADAKSRDTFLKAPETYLKTMLDCPVKGFKIKANKAHRVVVNDQILYFCCDMCPQAFQKEPNTYLAMVTDPVSGQDFGLSADAPTSTYKGTIYYFENADNKGKFDKEPAK